MITPNSLMFLAKLALYPAFFLLGPGWGYTRSFREELSRDRPFGGVVNVVGLYHGGVITEFDCIILRL